MTGEPQNQVEADNAGVKVPPPIVLILFILLDTASNTCGL
jgi:hypothetical protein